MYTKQPKKLMILNILDILRRYTDENHRLSQKEIIDILKTEYGMSADRKAVRRNILNLMDCGYHIEYSETIRMIPLLNPKTKKSVIDPETGKPKMEESYIWSDFYLERDFTDGELRLLIDSLLFSKHIPYSQCKELIVKLENLSNIYFKSRVSHISRLPDEHGDNRQLFLNIELLDEAISKKRKIAFKYIEYGTDKKIHIKKCSDGSERVYKINPYQMAAKEGKYYLICNYDKYDDISNYRLDRIRDIQILDEPIKPFESLTWAKGKTFDLAEYMREHIYMYSSRNTLVKLRVNHLMISDIIDMFGKNVQFSDEDEYSVCVSVKANEMSVEQFAKNYAPDVMILEPKVLAEKIQKNLRETAQQYDLILKEAENK